MEQEQETSLMLVPVVESLTKRDYPRDMRLRRHEREPKLLLS